MPRPRLQAGHRGLQVHQEGEEPRLLRAEVGSTRGQGADRGHQCVSCRSSGSGYSAASCRDLDLTSEVAAACGGRARCSLLADLVTVAILSGELQGSGAGCLNHFLISGEGDKVNEKSSCHRNFSALRTTWSCVAESALAAAAGNREATPSPAPSSGVSRQWAGVTPLTTASSQHERVEAVPLEPQPRPGPVSPPPASAPDYTRPLTVAASLVTAALCGVLVTLSYKLYHTFPSPATRSTITGYALM